MTQNSYDLTGSRGLSDFDARHRFVASVLYDLPFRGNRLVERLATRRRCSVAKRQPGKHCHYEQHRERRGGHAQARCEWFYRYSGRR